MKSLDKGETFRGKIIYDLVHLSNGWILLKTENSKSANDFRVRTVYQRSPRIRSYTPKHAHFAIDFYGKICSNRDLAIKVFQAIIDVWNGESVETILQKHNNEIADLPGYPLEYILYALKWILEQEDINFTGRPFNKQQEIDGALEQFEIKAPANRSGSELAISLFCNIAGGQHPVDAFIGASLDVLPVKRARGAI